MNTATGLTVAGLPGGTNYFVVRTFTDAHLAAQTVALASDNISAVAMKGRNKRLKNSCGAKPNKSLNASGDYVVFMSSDSHIVGFRPNGI